jgi:hypothetical protein
LRLCAAAPLRKTQQAKPGQIEELSLFLAVRFASNLWGTDNGIMNIHSRPMLPGARRVGLSVNQPLPGAHRQ